jgi:hypothetical protein
MATRRATRSAASRISSGRGVAIALVLSLAAACASGGTRAPSAKPLALRTDGTIDPKQVDLAGTAGVTAAEQRRAEDLLRRTIETLPRWNDVAQAVRDGFEPLGDGATGDEHYVHWDWIEDNDFFDPNRPESLVYHRLGDGRMELEAAMFILPKRYTLTSAPDVGGKLVQYHSHTNLCFTPFPSPRFKAFIRFTTKECPPGLLKLLTNVMIHVWIRPNPCGPFAPIGGLASGVVAPGESRLCDRAHGSAAD